MYKLEAFTPTPLFNRSETVIIPVIDTNLFVDALNTRRIELRDIDLFVYLRYISNYTRWPVSPDGIYFLYVKSGRGMLLIKREQDGRYVRLATDSPERAQLLLLNNNYIHVESATTLLQQLQNGTVNETCLNSALMLEDVNNFKLQHRSLIVMDLNFKYLVNFTREPQVRPMAVPVAAAPNAIDAYLSQFAQARPTALMAPTAPIAPIAPRAQRPTHVPFPHIPEAEEVDVDFIPIDPRFPQGWARRRPTHMAIPVLPAPMAGLPFELHGIGIPRVSTYEAERRIPDMDLSLFQVVQRDRIIESTLQEEEKGVTWYEFAMATFTPQTETDIHRAYTRMRDLPLVTTVLDSFLVDDGPIDPSLDRWKTCMSFVYFYPRLGGPGGEMVSKERICGLLDWLEINKLRELFRDSIAEKRLFSKISKLLEALPLCYKPYVAYNILSSIFMSYRRQKSITLSNWEPSDSASCGPGAIRYMVIECGTAIRTVLDVGAGAVEAEAAPEIDIGDWILHQLWDEDGERIPEWYLELRDGRSDASARIAINKERIMEFLVHKLRTHPVELLTEAKLRAFIHHQFELKQHGMFEHELGRRKRSHKRLRKRNSLKRKLLRKRNSRKRNSSK